MNQFHDTAAPPPMPLPQAQALHDMLHDHVNVLRAQLQIAEKARDNAAALVSSMQEPAAQYTTSQDFTTSSPRNSQDTKYGIALLRNNRGVLTIMNEKPNKVVVDSGAIKNHDRHNHGIQTWNHTKYNETWDIIHHCIWCSRTQSRVNQRKISNNHWLGHT